MDCPVCKNAMIVLELDEVEVDYCADCRGVWLDSGELELLLEEFARLAREHRFRLLLVAFPVRAQVETVPLFDYPQTRLKQIAGTLQLPYLDLLPSLREAHQKDKNGREALYFDHCHLTPYGNQLVTPILYQFLKRSIDSRGISAGP